MGSLDDRNSDADHFLIYNNFSKCLSKIILFIVVKKTSHS